MQIGAQHGKLSGLGLIRTKSGIPRVTDMKLLPSEMKEMIENEISQGLYTLEDIHEEQRKLERG